MPNTFYRHKQRAEKAGIPITTFSQMIADLGHSRKGASRIFHNHLNERGYSPDIIQIEKKILLQKFDEHRTKKLKEGMRDWT
ncbi:MAG: hypothetical protein V1672_04405 [Candidatus Diapherotrites archaeon]